MRSSTLLSIYFWEPTLELAKFMERFVEEVSELTRIIFSY